MRACYFALRAKRFYWRGPHLGLDVAVRICCGSDCALCRYALPCNKWCWVLLLQGDVMADKVPHCPVCTGVIKPDIVFFGEELPQRFFLHVTDFPMADLLFIIGTSLEVWD